MRHKIAGARLADRGGWLDLVRWAAPERGMWHKIAGLAGSCALGTPQ
jgi:hypothetical protein